MEWMGMTMKRVLVVLLLLTSPVLAQPTPSHRDFPLHWQGPTRAGQWRLQASDNWLPYLITGNGTFSLYKNVDGTWTTLDTSKDLEALKTEGLSMIPTSCAGSAVGTFWNDHGNASVCP